MRRKKNKDMGIRNENLRGQSSVQGVPEVRIRVRA